MNLSTLGLLPKYCLLLILILTFSRGAKAQVSVTDNLTAAQLAQQLVGAGVTYSNAVLTCPTGASGQFTVTGTSNLGIGSGIVLTTGKAKTNPATFVAGVDGDQATNFASSPNAAPGLPELTTLSGHPTHDACKLEFDFVPDGDSLLFNYVFGSEEYNDFSCSNYNDVFAFFLSGPLISGSPNIALIPGTSIPVTINSTADTAVTKPSSPTLCTAMGTGSPFVQYYNDNQIGTTITYYGLTKVLTARARVIPCTTYHITLAIADAFDEGLDSGVFLEANSFSSKGIKLSFNSFLGSNYDYLVEGCGQSTITARRPSAVPYPQVIHLSYGGTTTHNTDYMNAPDSIVIAADDSEATLLLAPVQDGIKEGDETIVVRTLHPCTGLPTDSITLIVKDYLPFTLISDDTAICQYDTVNLMADGNVANDSEWVWNWRSTSPWTVINQGKETAWARIDTSCTVFTSATFKGCTTDIASFFVRVEPIPTVRILTNDTTVCLHDSIQLRVDVVRPLWYTAYAYKWTLPENLSDPAIKEPKFFSQEFKQYPYTLYVNTPLGCTGHDTLRVRARPPLTLTNVTPDQKIAYGDSVQLRASGAKYYEWTPTTFLTYPLGPYPFASPEKPTVYEVYGINEYGCPDRKYIRVDIDYTMHDDIPTAFTPNGDGRNDVFNIRSLKFRQLQEFRIFNRWGAEVFSTTDKNQGWDGRYKDQPAEMGTYYFIIRVARPDGSARTYKGDVLLIR